MTSAGLGALAVAACLVLGCGDDATVGQGDAQSTQAEGESTSGGPTGAETAGADDGEAASAGDVRAETDAETQAKADADAEAGAETVGDTAIDTPAGADTEIDTPDEADPGGGAIEGFVVSADGQTPLDGVVVTAGDQVTSTGPDGSFAIEVESSGRLVVRHPTFLPVTVDPAAGDLTVTLEPVLARGVRVSREVAADPARYRDLLDQLEGTTVNSLVFDTKDETGQVLYDTEVDKAAELDAVRPLYRPEDLLADAQDRGLYPITRVVTFEDRIWAAADPEAKLAGAWVDATNQANWEYPIALADEACRLGFAEIQFDYVRYPAGRTAEVAASRVPATADERAAVIAAFLAEARSRLEPQGCGVSAAIFGIVMSSETDEGIGQTVEAVGAQVDALSPMLYPSHYGPGWLGFADPNDHPGPVIADALDDGLPRLTATVQMRPWIQAFYYNGAQIGAQITEAEARGAGWLLWNASGNYRDDWLPEAG